MPTSVPFGVEPRHQRRAWRTHICPCIQTLTVEATGRVSFRNRDAKTGQTQVLTLSGAAFLWLLLQHVLPKGFRRARNFGFLHPNTRRLARRGAGNMCLLRRRGPLIREAMALSGGTMCFLNRCSGRCEKARGAWARA